MKEKDEQASYIIVHLLISVNNNYFITRKGANKKIGKIYKGGDAYGTIKNPYKNKG